MCIPGCLVWEKRRPYLMLGPEDNTPRPIAARALCNRPGSHPDGLPVLALGLALQSRVTPSRKVGSSQLGIRVDDKSPTNLLLDGSKSVKSITPQPTVVELPLI
jgi:hypothetical protein